MKCGIASLSLFTGIKMIEYLTSTFDIRYSIFYTPVYFAETFDQPNQTMFIAYLSAYGDKPRPYE